MYFTKIALMVGCGALALVGLAAHAIPTSALEVKIELRVLDFIADPSDRIAVAVLYDRDNRGSVEEAAAIFQALQQSAGLARNKIAPRLLEVRSLDGAKGLKAVILTDGMAGGSDAVMRYGIANQTLVMASGAACLRDRRCMVGVTTLPDVEIGVNSSAIRDGHIRFADGFQLMVKEY